MFAFSPQRHGEPQRSHGEIVNPTRADDFFGSLLGMIVVSVSPGLVRRIDNPGLALGANEYRCPIGILDYSCAIRKYANLRHRSRWMRRLSVKRRTIRIKRRRLLSRHGSAIAGTIRILRLMRRIENPRRREVLERVFFFLLRLLRGAALSFSLWLISLRLISPGSLSRFR